MPTHPMASFTPEVTRPQRYVAPDLARGFMLLLIAFANVTWWADGANGTTSRLDALWLLIRTGFVDQRAYPLFGMLFGFGLATIARRHLVRTKDPHPERDTRRLLRRRGWWMLPIGLVHSLVFPGDVLGNYALAALLLAGIIVPYRRGWLFAVGFVTYSLGFVMAVNTNTAEALKTTGTEIMAMFPDYGWPLTPIVVWVAGTLSMAGFSLLMPAIVAGIWIERADWLHYPRRHLRLLATLAVVGLSVGFVGSLPEGVQVSGLREITEGAWRPLLNYFSAGLTAIGWLALLTWIASAFDDGHRHTWHPAHPLRFLTAIGKRSLSAYLTQTAVFTLFYDWANIQIPEYGAFVHAALAMAVWALIGVACWGMDLKGWSGPAEWVLRWLVAGSTKRAEKRRSAEVEREMSRVGAAVSA